MNCGNRRPMIPWPMSPSLRLVVLGKERELCLDGQSAEETRGRFLGSEETRGASWGSQVPHSQSPESRSHKPSPTLPIPQSQSHSPALPVPQSQKPESPGATGILGSYVVVTGRHYLWAWYLGLYQAMRAEDAILIASLWQMACGTDCPKGSWRSGAFSLWSKVDSRMGCWATHSQPLP